LTDRRGCGCGDRAIQPPTHFIGIGGAGMSAIAQVLRAAGCRVQGSDRSESPTIEMLRAQGIPVFIGHDPQNIGEMERVVYTRAVPDDNPELVAARRMGLPVLERAEMLGELYRLFDVRISVTGTHGKTSTTALLGHILTGCGKDPTVLVGGESINLGGHARLGKSSLVVSEACEAYSSFLHLRSSMAVVTNVDEDHLDWYHTFERVKNSFVGFMQQIDEGGLVVACADDRHLMSLRPRVDCRWLTYGFSPTSDVRVGYLTYSEGEQSFEVEGPDWKVGVHLPLPGRHLALNAAGALAAAVELGCDPLEAAAALYDFRGVRRRLEVKGRARGVTVLDDYAHHPAEIRATLEAVSEAFEGPLTVVFQPHLYSRTAEHLHGFAAVLRGVPRVVLTDVYAAREDPERGVQTDALYDLLVRAGHPDVHYVPQLHDVPRWLEEHVRPGDLVITVGAGDVVAAGEQFLRLAGAEAAQK